MAEALERAGWTVASPLRPVARSATFVAMIRKWTRGSFAISTDPRRLDLDVIHRSSRRPTCIAEGSQYGRARGNTCRPRSFRG